MNYIKRIALITSLVIAGTNTFSFARNIDAKQIGLLTYLHLKPGTEFAFKNELAKIIIPSRSEPGNIAWYVQQSQQDSTQIVFYTRWANQAALDFHLQSPPIVKYIHNTERLLAEPVRLIRFTPLDL